MGTLGKALQHVADATNFDCTTVSGLLKLIDFTMYDWGGPGRLEVVCHHISTLLKRAHEKRRIHSICNTSR